jgi:hypothetical protein
MPMPDYLFLGIPAILHLHMIFQHFKASLTPSAAVYKRAGCIPFHHQQHSLPVRDSGEFAA